MKEDCIHKRRGAYLPHWTKNNAIYSINFRLADALPTHVLKEWKGEREDILHTAAYLQRDMTQEEQERLRELQTKLDRYLDAGHGTCCLQKIEIADIVADALKYFDSDRYKLFAWCIMPNHVHVVVQPLNDHTLSDILHSWKSFTAKRMNKALNRNGQVWQEEYYDHLIRSPEDLHHAIEYTWSNPEKAGLIRWQWRWKGKGDPYDVFVEKTPCTQIRQDPV